jgi:4'-phosphopantetheinyl transferase
VLEHEVHVWRGKLDRAASHRALRLILGRYLGEDPETIELRRGERGKPALADPAAKLRFNLSHSGGLALIAVADGLELGIDVERIRPRRDLPRLSERALGPEAARAVRSAPAGERTAAFHRAWTRHEAIAKCHGVGLHAPLPPTPVAVRDIDVGRGYAAALAVAAEEMPAVGLLELPSGRGQRSGGRHLAACPR